ncbi:MAG: helix-turn-helix domain-containing protein [Hyphomicrobiales bacterium]|nr:helix-turn-helix domain-containing protein [Hyphomicrobiales bacterium]MCP5373751.1 helix-turn-helix domain-containing protein [Hyphomicrobiales bacterium]
MVSKVVNVGIASHGELKERALAIARGDRRRGRREPHIWFTSIESFAKVLSEPNRALLRIIDERQPQSLKELEDLTGRKVSNLSRTLKTMSRYGLVSLETGHRGTVRPKVLVREVRVDLELVG